MISPESLKEHHTDFFKIEFGFAVRRGQPFTITVETSKPLNLSEMTINFEVNEDEKDHDANNYPDFNTTVTKAVGETTYEVEVITSADAAVGKYDDIIMYVQQISSDKNSSLPDIEGFLYEYPFPVYFLFNPWVSEDLVYIQDEALRQEHILNEYGNVYCGSLNSYDSIKWYYGQSNQVTLDAAFHLLKKLDRSKMGKVIDVVQTVSHHQGMMRNKKDPDGPLLVGDWDALLEGNWGDFPFENDTNPESWTSTTDILNRWKETNKPTQYGQCWVFGALQNALMRALGVGSRQISAFGAGIDMSMMEDKNKKPHHVIDEYYDKNGTTVYSMGQLWNFHSWNDIYLTRDVKKYNGWQSLDGTPPGLGPAPVEAIKELDDNSLWNTSNVISTVHSTVRNFFVTCKKHHKKADKLKGCKVEKLLKYDAKGLRLIVSSKTAENGTLVMDNITSQFIEPGTDAFIPFDNDTLVNTNSLAENTNSFAENVLPEANMRIIPLAHGIVMGTPVEGSIVINTTSLREGEKVHVNYKITLETRTGQLIKDLQIASGEVTVGTGPNATLPYSVDAEAYLLPDLFDTYVKVVASAVAEESDVHYFDKVVMDIDAPYITLVAPDNMTASEVLPVTATFVNPLNKTLGEVCVTVHSHNLRFAGNADSKVTSVKKCSTLAAAGTITLDTSLVAPAQLGNSVYYVHATVSGNYIPFTQTDVEIVPVVSEEKNGQPVLRAFHEIADIQ